MAQAGFRHLLITAAILIGVAFPGSPVLAAQIEVIDGRYAGEKYVSISGPISVGDSKKVEAAAKTAIRQSNSRLAFLLNSEGGDIVEAMTIGRLARELLATTYVYGNTFYIPGTPEGKELEGYGKEYSQENFGLRPASTGKLNARDVVHCYGACVIMFYGGVSRYASDNNDYRAGYKNGRRIPVIGIHRPYYEQAGYSALSPAEARIKYQQLETTVRRYLLEMGAPTALIDRMFRNASSDVDLISSEEFEKLYRSNEPFIEEWLIAKCGGSGPKNALSEQEQEDYEVYRQSLQVAINAGQIQSSEDYDGFSPPGITQQRIRQLLAKVDAGNTVVMACQETAIRKNQAEWASHKE